jgi:8-oxo-dGTP diphosphatase
MPKTAATPPILTVDGMVFQIMDGKLSVLLVQRGFEPFKGAWALPGVYIEAGENSHEALERGLMQKTGVHLSSVRLVEQPFAFDAPNRDPRAYAVSVMYMGLCYGVQAGLPDAAATNLQNPHFTPLSKLPPLAYDHAAIVTFARNRLKSLMMYTNAAGFLLPKTFTLSQLQQAYEAIFGAPLDKRNFRKRILALNFVQETGKSDRDGAHRPAKLYQLAADTLQNYAPAFE